jgi:heme-degrading monooxygenase HmoA
MIIRIVKMTFIPEQVDAFKALFEDVKHKIINMPGCQHLELWKDINSDHVLYTYSIWNSEADLNHYRDSELFINTWKNTKIKFSEKAQAWSVEKLYQSSHNISSNK